MATLYRGQGEFLRGPSDPVTPLALQRQRLLQHAGDVIGRDASTIEAADITRLSQTLLTALELLKVADDELREERLMSAMIQAGQDIRIAHLDALFKLAPAALCLTTSDTMIRETNVAGTRMFGVDAYTLGGTRISEMVPRDQVATFKEKLALAIEVGSVDAWSFMLQLKRSAAATVCATMHVIDDAAVGGRALFWSFRSAT